MAEDLKSKIIKSIENLVTLEIITEVGDAAGALQKVDAKDPKKPSDTKSSKMIMTKIDLLQGDIKTTYHEDFITGPYQELKKFHASREREGYRIVMQNLAALEKLLKMVTENISD